MSLYHTTNRPSPIPPLADSHDLIRVQGARENNLKDISIEIPKRRLTVFTGRLRLGQELAGVRHHRRGVAAADQRDLQRLRAGLHAHAGAAGRRPPRGTDHGDHRRPGADGRQRPLHAWAPPPTPTPCCASSSAGWGSRTSGSPQAFSFNVPSARGAGADHRRAGRAASRGTPRPSPSPAACARAARAWAA